MLLWFAVLAPVLVAEVFRSPMIDYRMVALGAVLPVSEQLLGGAKVAHTLLGAVVVMALVMALTEGRRLLRRRWLGLPIGLLVHLVLDGTWTSKKLMWWPGFGLGFDEAVPEFDRGLAVAVVMELAAAVAAAWAWRRYGLADPEHRSRLIRTGHLARGVL